MRPRPAFYVVVALAVAATTALLKPRKPEAAFASDSVAVLVAAKSLPAGALLTKERLISVGMKAGAVFPSNLRSEELEQWVGKRLKVALSEGEPLREQDVGSRDPVGAVAQRGRAVTIDVAGHRAVDGQLSPADHVDVMFTAKDPQTNELMTRTMLQNAVVLGVTHREAPQLDSVTLLAIAEEAEMLALSQDLGSFTLSLRSPEDADTEELGYTTINTLLSGQRIQAITCRHRLLLADPVRGKP